MTNPSQLQVGQVYRDQFGGEWYIHGRLDFGRMGGGGIKMRGTMVTSHPDLSCFSLAPLRRGCRTLFYPAGDQSGDTMCPSGPDLYVVFLILDLSSRRAVTDEDREGLWYSRGSKVTTPLPTCVRRND